jgi:hypothetical protein
MCKTAGNSCDSHEQCCSHLCAEAEDGGTCVFPPLPVPDGGAVDSGGEGGEWDGPATGGAAGIGGPVTVDARAACAAYGEKCSTTKDCCQGDLGIACLDINCTRICLDPFLQ